MQQHQQQQHSHQSPMSSPARVLFYSGGAGGGSGSPPPMSPTVARLYALIRTLSEAPQDDVKYRALKEVSETLEDIAGTAAHASLVDSLIRVFVNLLQETLPQFIAENNTLQLRKLMLDMLLRMSSNERMKQYLAVLQQLLLQLIYLENEENALIIIKILTDHIKAFRPGFMAELMNPFFAQSKSVFNGMFAHSANEAMFLKRPFITAGKSIEESVAEALKTCYAPTTLSYSQNQQYTLVPRASQSVKVLAEMSVFLFVLIQAHRQQLIREVLELIPIFVRFVNIAVPRHIRRHKLYNKELVEEFHWAQVRALSFVAYISRQAQMAPVIGENAKALSDGIANLFDSFHDEVIIQRRDLLVAIKYFFQCDARAHFIGIIPKMFDDKALLGRSFTSQDHLRNQAYSFLADILHHVRMSLDQRLLKHIFFIASRNLHDAQLLPYVQTMYAKLMMNLIEAVVVQPKEHGQMFQQVLCAAVDSLVRNAALIAEYHLPSIVEKHRAQQIDARQQQQQVPSSSTAAAATEDAKNSTGPSGASKALDACNSFWQDSCQPLALSDCKNMVRFTVQPIKMMVIALKDLEAFENESTAHRLANLLTDFFRHGLKCLDIFSVTANVLPYPKMGVPSVRSKEEKDTIEAFVSTFTHIDATIFEQIIGQHIEFLISRILANPALQHVCNSLFKHPTTMGCLGSVLVKFLLSKLSELGGASSEKATLHLMLFKLIFQTVSFSPNGSESENLLKPFLHHIVQNSMRLAGASRESTNFFLLLRALFRSIGSGTHDLLYQQFLPLLPSILQQLNRLQNGAHRQSVHELFVELCLTIPVRLSSLLPYLPLLMDPLVCALNGSPALVQQGLRTLELCVDNLQPEYLYEHMMPVRAALVSGLWRTVHSSDVQSSLSALRILGKFGGSNRKALLDPQTWTGNQHQQYHHREGQHTTAPMLAFEWEASPIGGGNDHLPQRTTTTTNGEETTQLQQQRRFGCTLPLREAVQSAVSILRSQSVADASQLGTQMAVGSASASLPPSSANLSSKLQAVELIRNVLLVGIKYAENSTLVRKALSDAVKVVQQQQTTATSIGHHQQTTLSSAVDEQHHQPTTSSSDAARAVPSAAAATAYSAFVCADKFSRDIFVEALSGLFVAVFITETRTQILPFFKMFTKHLTVMAVLESNTANFQPTPVQRHRCLDSSILIDAIVVTLGDSCRDYCHTATLALRLMLETAASLFNGDREKACQLPLFSYIIDRVLSLCYCHEWFAHMGGCTALRMIVEHYPRAFVQRNAVPIFDACIETIFCLSDELSCGVIESASTIVDLLLDACFSSSPPPPPPPSITTTTTTTTTTPTRASTANGGGGNGNFVEKGPPPPSDVLLLRHLLTKFVTRLVHRLDSSEQTLRDECLRIIRLLAEKAKLSLADLMKHYDGDLQEKIRQRMGQFVSASVNSKIALIHFFLFFANIDGFCMELSLRKLETLAQNLLHIVHSNWPLQPPSGGIPPNTHSNVGSPSMGVQQTNMATAEAAEEQKVQLIKASAIEALVTLYNKTVSASFVNPRKQQDEQLFESDLGDIDLRGPQYLMDIFELLIRTLLNEDNETLRATAQKGIAKILSAHLRPEHSVYITMKLGQFVDQFRNKNQFISKRFFEKLIFLSAHSTTKLSPMDLQMISLDLSLIMKTTPSSLKVEDIECVTKALELFHALSHKSGPLLREVIDFFANCLFNFSPEQRKKWVHAILPFMNALSVDFADVFLSRDLSIGPNSHRFLIELIRTDGSADLLRKSLLKHLSLLEPFIVELIDTSKNEPDAHSSLELNLLNFLVVLLDNDDGADNEEHAGGQTEEHSAEPVQKVFEAVRSLWCSDTFKKRHSVRKALVVLPTLYGSAASASSSSSDYAFDNATHNQSSSSSSSATVPTTDNAGGVVDVLDMHTMDCPALCARVLLVKLRSLFTTIRRTGGGVGGEEGTNASASSAVSLPANAAANASPSSPVVGKTEQQQQQHQELAFGWSSPLVRESIDLVYDLVTAFEHQYASDFTFLRKFIDTQIVAKASLPWRRATFTKLIDLIPTAGQSVQLVRFVQYIVAPVFAYAFEMYDVDAVVVGDTGGGGGGAPEDENIVLLLCHKVIQRLANERSLVSDSLTIIMYLFCSLVVQKCPLHIYDPAKKQHGNRQEQGNLRHFMLFAWPCLQQSFQGDVTEKFAGHFLIANIIDKFSIIRTIILQVLNSLLLAHHNFQDNRELVRKSLEILIPALPRRMPDGYLQLQTLFRKIIVEEGRNSAQVGHCLQIIVRHHKVFYNIRHQIAPLILSALHRLFSLQLNFETRRLMLEVCEAVIKWEQHRQTVIEERSKMTTTSAGADSIEGGGETVITGQQHYHSDERPSSVVSESSSSSATAHSQHQHSTASTSAGGLSADTHKPLDKQFVDSIVTFLFRIATFVDQYAGSTSTTSTTGMEHINRRAVLLLRSALKPAVFGDTATLRTTIIEKQLQLPNTEQFGTANEQVISHQLSQVQATLDVLTNITLHLMPRMVLDIFRPLQRTMIACLSYINSQQILRSTYNVLSKLLEKTKCSSNGLDELELLNHHIIRIIHDSFAKYAGSLNNASPPMTTITLLRLMHSAQPSYLETVCLMPFINLLQRLVREHIMSTNGGTTSGVPDQAQKLISDLLAICLEMLCTRTRFLDTDSQRTIIQIVLFPLIEKSTVDKIVENVVKVTQEIVASEVTLVQQLQQQQQHDDQQQQQQQPQYHLQQPPQIGPPAVVPPPINYQQQQSRGVLVLVKLFSAMELRLGANSELQRNFLNVVIQLYEHEQLLFLDRNLLDKLEPAFHWGLASPDRELRNRFFVLFERRFPKDTVQRLVHIMVDENWQQMGRYDWLAHVLHLLLLSEHGVVDEHQQQQQQQLRWVKLAQCATLNNTLAQIFAAVSFPITSGPTTSSQQQPIDAAVQPQHHDGMMGSPPPTTTTTKDSNAGDDTTTTSTASATTIQARIASLRISSTASTPTADASSSLSPSTTPAAAAAVTPSGADETTTTTSLFSSPPDQQQQQQQHQQQQQQRTTIFDMQMSLLSLANQLTAVQLISNLVDILHTDATLCRKTFISLFCSLWSTFTPDERAQVERVAGPFLSSAVHLCQRDSPHAVVTAFMEAFQLCSPPIKLEPFMLSYLGSTFNCWHVAMAQLERLAMDIRFSVSDPILLNPTGPPGTEKLEVLDCLGNMYQRLDELDQYSGLWKRRSYFDKTAKCLALFQQGEFARAREIAEKLVAQLSERLSKTMSPDSIGAGLSTPLQAEQRAWEQCWISSCKQLNDWTSLEHFAKSDEISDAALSMESAWHLHDWNQLKDRFAQVDAIASPQTAVRSSMLQLMLNVTNFRLNKETIEGQLNDLYRALISDWRRLPPIVSHSHIDILHNSHLLHEISEAANLLYSNLPPSMNWSGNSNAGGNNGTNTSNSTHLLNNAVKHLMKTWRNRPLTTVDQNTAWLDLFNWRLQFFNSLLRFYDNTNTASAERQHQSFAAAASSPLMTTALSVPLHAIAQCHLQQAHAFRRSNQLELAQQELNKINVSVLAHPIDAQQKLEEQVKCLLKCASGNVSTTAKKMKAHDSILEALETIEGTSFQFMKRDQIARLMTNKGILLSRMDKREEAGRAFSAAAQLELSESAIPSSFAAVWKHWATFLGNLYLANHSESSALSTGVQAMACTLEHILMVGAQKSRTSVAKLFWLLKIASSCPSEKLRNTVDELLSRYVDTIHPANWLFWLNELVSDVQQRKGNAMAEVLKRVGLAYPQEVFCALRVELGPPGVNRYIERYIAERQLLSSIATTAAAPLPFSSLSSKGVAVPSASSSSSSSLSSIIADSAAVAADTAHRRRLFAVLDALLKRHLAHICALNRVLDALDNFGIGPVEITLNKFRQFLSVCHFDQFTKIADLANTPTDSHLLHALVEWLQSPDIAMAASADTEEGKLLTKLLNEFNFCTVPFRPSSQQQQQQLPSVPLHRVASALRQWVVRIGVHLRRTLGTEAKRLADASPYLAQFNSKLATLNIFDGHFNVGTSPHFNTQIAHFLPLFDECVRNDSVFRLIRLRALNGKIYSYQLERVRYNHSRAHIFQLFCLLNTEFVKCRNTARRFVQFALPHTLFTGANCRLLRCCPLAGLSARAQNANADHSTHNFALFADILAEMLLHNGNATTVSDDGTSSSSSRQIAAPLSMIDQYYGRLAEQRYSHKTIHELFNQICGSKGGDTTTIGAGGGGGTDQQQQHANNHHHPSSSALFLPPSPLVVVPKDLLSRWMGQRYEDATTLWMVRKKLAVQFALLALSEHALFLSSMRPDALFLDLPTGQLFFTDYKFDLTKKVCETISGKVPFIELDANRPVPFRLTPNISHFLGLSLDGHFIGALIAVARSLNALSLEVWLRPILWDVFAKVAEDDPQLNIVNPVKRASDTIVARVKALSQYDVGMGSSSQQLLVQHSMLSDNLCRMDPAWHPWF